MTYISRKKKHKKVKFNPTMLDDYHRAGFGNLIYSDTCIVCNKVKNTGKRFYLGQINNLNYICDDCLILFQKALSKSKFRLDNPLISISVSDKKERCDICLKKSDLKQYHINLNGYTFYACELCKKKLYSKLKLSNQKTNIIYQQEIVKEKEIIKNKYLKKKKIEDKKAELERVKADKIRKEEEYLKSLSLSKDAIKYYFTLNEKNRLNFIKQAKMSCSWKNKYYITKMQSQKRCGLFSIYKAYKYIRCSISDKYTPAKYFIVSKNMSGEFAFAISKFNFKQLQNNIYSILSDPFIISKSSENIIINRTDPLQNHQECIFCRQKEQVYYLKLGSTYFYICRNCVMNLFNEMNKIQKLQNENCIYELPDFSDRVMNCKKYSKSRIIIGYPAKKAKNERIKFITELHFMPINCEGIGHILNNLANAVIYTNHYGDNFCLVLCRTCITNLINVLEKDSSISNNYNDSYIRIIKFDNSFTNETCLFCGERLRIEYRIIIGNVEFRCCHECKMLLLDSLKQTQTQLNNIHLHNDKIFKNKEILLE